MFFLAMIGIIIFTAILIFICFANQRITVSGLFDFLFILYVVFYIIYLISLTVLGLHYVIETETETGNIGLSWYILYFIFPGVLVINSILLYKRVKEENFIKRLFKD